MNNLKWLLGIILVALCILVGFFIGKSVYDLPIPHPPNTVFDTSIVYIDTSVTINVDVIKRKAYHRGYTEGIEVPNKVLYYDVDSLSVYKTLSARYGEEVKTTFTSKQEYFTAKFILLSTIDIRDYLTQKPKFTFQYRNDINKLFYDEYNRGYSLGYSEGRVNIPFWKKIEYAAYGAGGFFIIQSTINIVRGN